MPSGQAIVNPNDIQKFVAQLKAFNTELQSNIHKLQAQFKQLGSTWRDQEHAKFAKEFEQTIKAINKFNEISNNHIPFLLKKAKKAEEYLNQR